MGDVAKKVGVVAKNWELSYLELSLFRVVAKKVGVVALGVVVDPCIGTPSPQAGIEPALGFILAWQIEVLHSWIW